MSAASALERTVTPPVRLAHLGLGAFHRAHQAWYTQRANDAVASAGAATGTDTATATATATATSTSAGSRAGSGTTDPATWGIASFTGRSPDAAVRLAAQDGVYTLLERSAAGDRAEIVQAIVRAIPGSDDAAWLGTLADPAVAALTVTVTEPAYAPDAGPAARIAAGLAARRAADGGEIAVISCDNLPGNGQRLRAAVLANAGENGAWIADHISFVDTVVDRITPATTADDIAAARALTGVADPCTVVTEPFAEWVLAGEFPAGRPGWEAAGARFVADAAPYEERKLWLLNASHSVLAAAGRLRGLETIAEAFADPQLRAATEQLWQEQRAVIDLPAAEIDGFIAALRIRYDNPRIAHRLDQIRRDSVAKIPVRLLAPIRRRVQAGLGIGAAQQDAVRLWIRSVLELEPTDAATAELARTLGTLDPGDRIDAVLTRLTPSEGTPA